MKRKNKDETVVLQSETHKNEIISEFHSKSGHSGMYAII